MGYLMSLLGPGVGVSLANDCSSRRVSPEQVTAFFGHFSQSHGRGQIMQHTSCTRLCVCIQDWWCKHVHLCWFIYKREAIFPPNPMRPHPPSIAHARKLTCGDSTMVLQPASCCHCWISILSGGTFYHCSHPLMWSLDIEFAILMIVQYPS